MTGPNLALNSGRAIPQLGFGVFFPKSTTPARIKENFEIFDFELEPDDVAAISALDRGEEGRTGPNPDVFAYIPR